MTDIIKSIVWIVGLLTIAYFALDYFGYEINQEYFTDSKAQCERKLKECTDKLLHQGIDNAKCNFKCVDPKIIIKNK